jgi:drug/metabolite transporter (DMT)-like permease
MTIHLAAIGTMVVLSCGQILLKLLAVYIGSVQGRVLDQPNVMLRIAGFLAAIAVTYGLVFGLWMFVLRTVELNRAFLYAALTFVFVPLLSYVLLGETIRPATIAGAVLIICGIAISATL